jgi:hypothetical protein
MSCHSNLCLAGVAQLARARPCQGRGRGFEPHHPLHLFQGGNMNTFCLFFAAILASSTSLAHFPIDEFPSDHSTTRMDSLVRWFEQGEDLILADLDISILNGRCYLASAKSDPKAGLLTKIQLRDDGPGFPDQKKLTFLFAPISGPSHYEDATEEEIHNTIKRFTESKWDHISFPYLLNGALTVDFDWEVNGNIDEQDQYRKYNDFIVMISRAQIKQKYHGVLLNKGETQVACYFFGELFER